MMTENSAVYLHKLDKFSVTLGGKGPADFVHCGRLSAGLYTVLRYSTGKKSGTERYRSPVS